MKTLAFLLSLFIFSTVNASEFEGIITYKVEVHAKTKSVKVGPLRKVFGKKHLFYYKNGSYKWVADSKSFEYELFNPQVNRDFIINKFHDNDTLYYSPVTNSKDSVSKFEKHPESIVFHEKICYGATAHVTNKKGKVYVMRTWYCPKTDYDINPEHFSDYRSMGQNKLYDHFKALPLFMIIEWPGRSYYVTYTAIKTERIPLDDSEFIIDSNAPFKYEEE